MISDSVRSPQISNVIFYSSCPSIDGKDLLINSCYALKFYEKYLDKKSKIEYYIPKAFLIYSQYQYFTIFSKICHLFTKL